MPFNVVHNTCLLEDMYEVRLFLEPVFSDASVWMTAGIILGFESRSP